MLLSCPIWIVVPIEDRSWFLGSSDKWEIASEPLTQISTGTRHKVMFPVLKHFHIIIKLDVHLDLLFASRCLHNDVIVIFTDQCWCSLCSCRLSRRGSSLALHVGFVFKCTFVPMLAVAFGPSITMTVFLSSRGLWSPWRCRPPTSLLTILVLPLVPMVLRVTILAFGTMFAVTLVEVEMTKGLWWISGRRWSRSPTAVALALAMTFRTARW